MNLEQWAQRHTLIVSGIILSISLLLAPFASELRMAYSRVPRGAVALRLFWREFQVAYLEKAARNPIFIVEEMVGSFFMNCSAALLLSYFLSWRFQVRTSALGTGAVTDLLVRNAELQFTVSQLRYALTLGAINATLNFLLLRNAPQRLPNARLRRKRLRAKVVQ